MEYAVQNVCYSAAIYRRNINRANFPEEAPKYPVFSVSENFPNLTIQEEIGAIRVAKGLDKSTILLKGISYKVKESKFKDCVLLESGNGGCAVGLSTTTFVIAFFRNDAKQSSGKLQTLKGLGKQV